MAARGQQALARKSSLVDAHGRDIEILEKEEPAALQAAVTHDLSPEALIARAIDKGVPVEQLERLMAMRREIIADRARAAFNASLKAFQAECPIIKPTKSVHTKSGAKAYSYAPIEIIVKVTGPLLDKHGFAYQFATETKDHMVKAYCTAKHIGGHTEVASVELPLGGKTDIMSATQHVQAALTFAKRYAFRDVFGIATGDADTDAGKGTEPTISRGKRSTDPEDEDEVPAVPVNGKTAGAVITKMQQDRLVKAIADSGRNPKSISAWWKTKYGVDHSSKIQQVDYETVVDAIKAPGALPL